MILGNLGLKLFQSKHTPKSKFSPYKIALIEGKKQWLVAFAVLLVLFSARVGYDFYVWSKLPFDTPGEIKAQVLLQYQKTKDNKTYWVLKLDSGGHIFYMTSREDLKPLQGRYIRVYGKTKCKFLEYFKSCFFINFTFSVLPQRDFIHPVTNHIDMQHQNPINASLFKTLFFGTALHKQWRDVSNLLGLAHIIAISGFHLGVLSSFLFVILAPMYRFLQRRYFSYRNELYDLGFIILCALFGYLIILDFLPSFLRAFVMGVIGFVLYYSGLQIVNFKLLGLVGLVCVTLFPSVLVNIGFILSMFGVFYILLFVRYVQTKNLILYWIVFNIVIFISITPIVHYFFSYFSPYQLVSIPVSLSFVVFFPLMIVLHCIGLGGIFDKLLDFVLVLQIPSIDYYLPLPYMLFYAILGFGAIYFKKLYIAMLLCALGFYGFLLFKFITNFNV